MKPIGMTFAVVGMCLSCTAMAQSSSINLESYKALYPNLTQAERSVYDRALADKLAEAQSRWVAPDGPVEGDICTVPAPGAINPFLVSSTTVGATNNYDIATTCGVAQTGFGGTGASLDVAYGVVTDANCTVTVTGDPTGASWDLALFVLEAPGAACTILPALADPQCVSMDDDGGGNITEVATFNAIAGNEYFVIVDGFNAATGTFDLNISGTGCNLIPVGLQSFSVD